MVLKLVFSLQQITIERGGLITRSDVNEAVNNYKVHNNVEADSYFLYADDLDPQYNEGDLIEQGELKYWEE